LIHARTEPRKVRLASGDGRGTARLGDETRRGVAFASGGAGTTHASTTLCAFEQVGFNLSVRIGREVSP
jgi:hypothetical protein